MCRMPESNIDRRIVRPGGGSVNQERSAMAALRALVERLRVRRLGRRFRIGRHGGQARRFRIRIGQRVAVRGHLLRGRHLHGVMGLLRVTLAGERAAALGVGGGGDQAGDGNEGEGLDGRPGKHLHGQRLLKKSNMSDDTVDPGRTGAGSSISVAGS